MVYYTCDPLHMQIYIVKIIKCVPVCFLTDIPAEENALEEVLVTETLHTVGNVPHVVLHV